MSQVPKEHYTSRRYHSLERFLLYYSQIELVFDYLQRGKLLEIGVGNKMVSDYLKKFAVDVTTCDFDPVLEPDVIADIRNLPFKDKSFDLVTAFEVLEHIPFVDFGKALSEMGRVSRSHVIFSVPIYGMSLEIYIKWWKRPLFQKRIWHWGWVKYLHTPFRKDKEGFGEHYWEIGTQTAPLSLVKKIISDSGFWIERITHPPLERTIAIFILRSSSEK